MRGIVRGQQTVEFEGVLAARRAGLRAGRHRCRRRAGCPRPERLRPARDRLPARSRSACSRCTRRPIPTGRCARYAAQWGAGAAGVLVVAAALTVVAAAIDPGALGVLAPVGEPARVRARQRVRSTSSARRSPLIGWLFSLIPLPHRQQDQQAQPMPSTPIAKQPEDQHDAPLWTRIIGWVHRRRCWHADRRRRDRRAVVALPPLREAQGAMTASAASASKPNRRWSDDLGAAFDALARRFRRGPRPAAVVASKCAASTTRCSRRSAAAGLERPPAATPLQFAPQLDAHYRVRRAVGDQPAPSPRHATALTISTTASWRDLRARWRALDEVARRSALRRRFVAHAHVVDAVLARSCCSRSSRSRP